MAGYIFSKNQIPMMSIPTAIADRFLGVATGVQIKVLLCLFRFEDMPLTKEAIAKQCNISADDVETSLDFWLKSGLLIRRGASLVLSGVATEQPQTLPRYNPENVLQYREEDNVFANLLDEIQRILGKTINHNDASVILAMYDHMGFSTELVLHLVNYCKSIGKLNFRYIEKVSLDWYDRGIDSFEKAESYIRNLERTKRLETAVATYFGIDGRALSKKEKEYIETWSVAFGMSLEMIKEAYELCIDKKSKLSFAYINGILADWHKKGYKTLADIKKDTPVSKDDKSYDTNEIEQEILRRLAGEN